MVFDESASCMTRRGGASSCDGVEPEPFCWVWEIAGGGFESEMEEVVKACVKRGQLAPLDAAS